ncbi:MAG: long-chain fatty acid--CoA ligase [Desulfovibrionaceae bacterium]|nr:long-chain fatty acid--CoA ligase [Desulfovibrionaceae bacterium]MBF0513191.1 long-chain fatty acid--CoA ligase [Desulfovibrionaceae bacterium]
MTADPHRPWLAKYDKAVRPNLEYPEMTVPMLLERAAGEHPNHPAVEFFGASVSYRRLLGRVRAMASSLTALGVAPGEHVAVMLPNIPQAITAFYAVLTAGAVAVMVNPLYTEREIAFQLRDSQAATLICLDLFWPKIQAVRGETKLSRVIVTSVTDGLPFALRVLAALKSRLSGKQAATPCDGKTVIAWKRLAPGSKNAPAPAAARASDPAVAQYTGGTTGTPKGAVLTHANLTANVLQCREILHAIGRRPERFLAVLPYFHIYGLTVCLNLPVAIGATILPVPKFEPAGLLALIAKRRPTIFPGAPALYAALLRQKDLAKFDLTSLRFLVSGSAPIPPAHMQKFKEITGAEIIEGYGLTEASPVTHFNPLEGEKKPGSIGLPLPDTLTRIVGDDGREAPVGEPGELWIKGPQVMRGYLGREAETAQALSDGWLATGDVATMDADGYFYIVDRKKDLIISGGYNVYPREVEEVLGEHPSVREACVVGVKHAVRGEIIKAVIVAEGNANPAKEDILAFCKTRLAPYKCPKQIEFVDELPRTAIGKVLRRNLKEVE